MKKKFINLLMLGAIALTPTLFSSCSDYDDDINRLEGMIGKNTDAISAVQSLLKDGVVITNIASTGTGLTITTSDLQTWTLTNGKDGKDGKDGINGENGKDADAWTIGDDGYWYKNGVKTDYRAIGLNGKDGKDGIDGKDGANGTNGQNGKDGNDGGYYVPYNDGYFYYVGINSDGTYADPVKTDISWVTASMSAIKSETGVIFYGVNGYPDGFTISTIADLKSMVFKPQLVVDGVNAINAGALTKNGQIICTPNVTAEYHLNPSTVVEQGIKTNSVSFITLTKDYIKTRAVTDVTAEYQSINNGVMKVGVNFKGTPSVGGKIDLVALQAENASGEIITSDYATIYTNPFASENLFIARGAYISTLGANSHYWATENEAKNVALNDAAVNPTATQDKRIIEVLYNGTVNLFDEIKTCLDANSSHRRFSDAEMDSYHLKYKFEKINSFLISTTDDAGLKVTTDQEQFIDLASDGTVTPKTYQDGSQLRSAIGRTPIVKATLYHQEGNGQETILQQKYVVLEIVDKIQDPGPGQEAIGYPFEIFVDDAFQATQFCGEVAANIKAEDMNTVYSKLGLSKEEFGAQYEVYRDAPITVKVDGTQMIFQSSDNVDAVKNVGQYTTYGLIWTLSYQDLWNYAGQVPSAKIVFKHKTLNKYVQITLKGVLPLPAKQTVNFPSPGKLLEYWEADSKNVPDGRVLINVRVPNLGDTNPNECLFTHNMNSFFKPGQEPLTVAQNAINASNYRVNPATFVDANDVKLVFISGSKDRGVTTTGFSAQDDKLYYNSTLVATLNGTTIDLEYNNVAKELLNTNDFVVTIGYKATFHSCLGWIDIPSTGSTSFEARFVRPINVSSESADHFKDGVDFGVMGSTLLKARDVIKLTDWRGLKVEEGNNYWLYYGIQNVTVNNPGVLVEFPKTEPGKKYPINQTLIKAGIYKADTASDPDLSQGFIAAGLNAPADYDLYVFYKNNGGVLKDPIKLYFPVVVTYYWGVADKSTVVVEVDPTTNVNNAPKK